MVSEPLPIPVGQEPPPMRRPPSSPNGSNGRPPARHQGDNGKAKGKPARRKAGDRFAVLNAFVDFTLAGLTRNEIAVWLVLYRDTKDGTAGTSQADLARRAGVSDRTIRRALKRLEIAGLLKVVYRGGFRRGLSRYRVCPLRTEGA
jgi:DNA-binding transcriptional ArsR family regulator